MGCARSLRLAAAAVGLLATVALGSQAAAQKKTKADREAEAATPEQVADKVAVSDDPLDTVITLSTEPFTARREGLLRVVNSDKFLRAFLDKKSGATSLQVYVYVTYSGDWAFMNRATVETPDGPEDAELTEIRQDVISCRSILGCTHREDVAITVPEQLLRQVSDGARAGTGEEWSFRIYAKNGQAFTTGLLKTEVAGLLIALDRERAKLSGPDYSD